MRAKDGKWTGRESRQRFGRTQNVSVELFHDHSHKASTAFGFLQHGRSADPMSFPMTGKTLSQTSKVFPNPDITFSIATKGGPSWGEVCPSWTKASETNRIR